MKRMLQPPNSDETDIITANSKVGNVRNNGSEQMQAAIVAVEDPEPVD